MKDLEDLEKVFEKGLQQWPDIVENNSKIMGQKLKRECARLTKVKSGTLRRTWFFRIDHTNNEVLIWVSNPTEYAAWVNYGHRVVRAHKTVGFRKGEFMLEKGIENYKVHYLKSDVDKMLLDLKKAMK